MLIIGTCVSASNPVTAELFGDDLPKAVKDITDTNRLTSKLTKENYSRRSGYRPGGRDRGRSTYGKRPFSANNCISFKSKSTNAPFNPGSGRADWIHCRLVYLNVNLQAGYNIFYLHGIRSQQTKKSWLLRNIATWKSIQFQFKPG